jgi:hypothetical protein
MTDPCGPANGEKAKAFSFGKEATIEGTMIPNADFVTDSKTLRRVVDGFYNMKYTYQQDKRKDSRQYKT